MILIFCRNKGATASIPALGLPKLLSNEWEGGAVSLCIIEPRREAEKSFPSLAELNNALSCSRVPPLPTSLQGKML
jgi:hypothetical protein